MTLKTLEINKSPFNYIGGKYKLLPQLFDFFPKKVDTFVDLFGGGGDVFINIKANNIYANDINNYLIEIYEKFKSMSIEELLDYIDSTIVENNLSKENKDTFLAFREKYNNNKNPLDLYVLVCYSFNYQFRFNSRHDFNNTFGSNRSWFNPTIRDNLIKFHRSIQGIKFTSKDFRDFDYSVLKEKDFLYADPPYLITTGSYNDGKRGFNGWAEKDDLDLFRILDSLNERNVKFALSNVTEHNNLINENLIKWGSNYNVHEIISNYSNSNYQSKINHTKEVLITNY